jgi:Mg-chelatase subunit ChlD
VDVVLAVDISGSMAGGKLKILVSAVKLIMESLTDADRLAVVTFESKGKRLTRLLRLTK